MQTKPLIAIVGTDGFVGGRLADALDAKRIVYGPCQNGDVHVSRAQGLLQQADVIINAGGFRLRPGLSFGDYQRSHLGAAAALVQHVRRGSLFLHISSASVFGKSRSHKLGNDSTPNPKAFPSPAYAIAKFEADQFLEKAAEGSGFRLVFLRPGVLYAPHTDGMVDTLLRLAKRRIVLRLYPRDARHHLCDVTLLVEVVRRIIRSDNLPCVSSFVIADPEPVTNRELEGMIRRNLPGKGATLPIPVPLATALLRHSFRSRNPRFDLPAWSEILGVIGLDTVYETSDTFQRLDIDPAQYSSQNTLESLVRQALQR